jgi:tRNA-Thr(GGU) m(6)t(6)A37 methyltransferase TsaA
MVNELPVITLKAIGSVRSEIKARSRQRSKKLVSEIVVDKDFTEALDNLDEYSHIIVLYYIHQSRTPAPLKVHPRKRFDLPPVGVFASRSPDRPNPIGKSTVRLLQRHDNVLVVEGLDAIDGTPVLVLNLIFPGSTRWIMPGCRHG